MQFKSFGRTGVEVCTVGQGTWDIPESGRARADAIAAIRRGIALEMTHLDTAEMYGSGNVERILGEAIAGCDREQLFVTSKVLPSNASFDGTIDACDRTLARLGLAYLDCYLLHWPSGIPLRETMRAFRQLVSDGKTKHVGVSNFDTDMMLEAQRLLGDVPLACNQVLYHLHERGIEHTLIPAAAAHDIAVVAYTPFGRGQFPRSHVLDNIAADRGVSVRAVVLAFLTRDENVFAIPKASQAAHVEENARAGDLTLNADEIDAIDAAFPRGDAGPLATA